MVNVEALDRVLVAIAGFYERAFCTDLNDHRIGSFSLEVEVGNCFWIIRAHQDLAFLDARQHDISVAGQFIDRLDHIVVTLPKRPQIRIKGSKNIVFIQSFKQRAERFFCGVRDAGENS